MSNISQFFPPWAAIPKYRGELEVHKEESLLETLDVSSKRAYLFGRGVNSTVELSHPSISRTHACLCHHPQNGAMIADLGSAHGTVVIRGDVVQVKLSPFQYVPLRNENKIIFGASTRSYIYKQSTQARALPEEEGVEVDPLVQFYTEMNAANLVVINPTIGGGSEENGGSDGGEGSEGDRGKEGGDGKSKGLPPPPPPITMGNLRLGKKRKREGEEGGGGKRVRFRENLEEVFLIKIERPVAPESPSLLSRLRNKVAERKRNQGKSEQPSTSTTPQNKPKKEETEKGKEKEEEEEEESEKEKKKIPPATPPRKKQKPQMSGAQRASLLMKAVEFQKNQTHKSNLAEGSLYGDLPFETKKEQ